MNNLEKADARIAETIGSKINSLSYPLLIIPVNGMNNFDLADELSRQVLKQIRLRDLDTSPIEDLWPRFQVACAFVERNFSLWKDSFSEAFGPDTTDQTIMEGLKNRNETVFKKVNAIYEKANGFPIHAVGAESPKQLLETVCKNYCGDDGPFQSVLILFDEFGRYLEFAVEKPHIAGDAALQQIFEGVHENAEQCAMLCTIQYELKTYISRVSHERQNTISRFVGRYDSSKKYYLSSNLETLFAHLIEKKDPEFILNQTSDMDWEKELEIISQWISGSRTDQVWRDVSRFKRVIVEGCWPFHPLTILFLRQLSDRFQPRSALAYIADTINRYAFEPFDRSQYITATDLFQLERGLQDRLLKDLIATENFSSGAASAYSAVEEKYRDVFSSQQRLVLLSVLIADKAGFEVFDRNDAHFLFFTSFRN